MTGRINICLAAALLTALAGGGVGLSGCSQGDAAEITPRSDLVVMDGLAVYAPLERPIVLFPHDLHTSALARRHQDCSACHPAREDGRPSLLFMRLTNPPASELEELYHRQCIGCHSRIRDSGETSGPEACGQCHRRETRFVSSRLPIGFDKSLHYRHVKANENKCERCHHVYDETSKKLVYRKDTESSCRDCHGDRTVENRISLREAAHRACVGCHLEASLRQPVQTAGPMDCAGCHSRDAQLAIKVIDNPPRLERGQPDFVLLSAAEADLPFSKLNTVPFDHAGHEAASENCRVCHHETMSPCGECHTLAGLGKGGGVTLQETMHDLKSKHSCIGCHNRQKSAPDCAGCHGLMEQERISEHACDICHAGPDPEILARVRSKYTSLDDFRPRAADVALGFKAEEIPDSLSIGVLSKEYPAVIMPHRKIVDKLREGIDRSRIAVYFHDREDVLCRGCHHHGSIGRKPALCENCHSRLFDERDLFKPILYSAYHRQCIGCHPDMDMKEPTDCATCHPRKLQTAGAN